VLGSCTVGFLNNLVSDRPDWRQQNIAMSAVRFVVVKLMASFRLLCTVVQHLILLTLMCK